MPVGFPVLLGYIRHDPSCGTAACCTKMSRVEKAEHTRATGSERSLPRVLLGPVGGDAALHW
jgi:hypothetical protein